MDKQATVKAEDLPNAAPDKREVAREHLLHLMDRIGEGFKNVPDAEIDEAINEARQFARRTSVNAHHS